MSYLNPLRLHFAGRFQAAVSTINNTPSNYDKVDPTTVGWNPGGDGDYRLVGCGVTAAFGTDGMPVPEDDPVLGCLVADSDRLPPAKLVDLDPDQQMVSQIWGLEVRICAKDGTNLVRGSFKAAPFTDLWIRALTAAARDQKAGAMYQSTIGDLEWGPAGGSDFVDALRAAATDGLLSIKFNVDGYDRRPGTDGFTFGRAVGTIGPAAAGEPHHYVAGRHLMPPASPAPSIPANFCQAVVDRTNGKVLLDIGNAVPTETMAGPPPPNGPPITLVCEGANPPLTLGDIPYQQPRWYETTAGVASLPADRSLTADELDAVAANPLSVVAGDGPAAVTAVLEPADGLHVRADDFVFRLDPEARATVDLMATHFGSPHEGTAITLAAALLDSGDPAPGSQVELSKTEVVTGPDGRASFEIVAHDPGTPRAPLDGQVYVVSYTAAGSTFANGWDFVSLLLFSGFTPSEPVKWDDIAPTLKQYAQLYPIMSRFLDLSKEDSVASTRDLLRMSFALPIEHPNSMPVTRDLSAAKRKAIVAWLDGLGPFEPPEVPGEAPPTLPTPGTLRQAAALAPEAVVDADDPKDAQIRRGLREVAKGIEEAGQ
jgi:hypothetical protein